MHQVSQHFNKSTQNVSGKKIINFQVVQQNSLNELQKLYITSRQIPAILEVKKFGFTIKCILTNFQIFLDYQLSLTSSLKHTPPTKQYQPPIKNTNPKNNINNNNINIQNYRQIQTYKQIKMQNKINNKNASNQHHQNNSKKIYPSRQQLALLLQQENTIRDKMMNDIEGKKELIEMLRGRVVGEGGDGGGVSVLLAEYMVNEMELCKSKAQMQNRISVTRQQIWKQEQQLQVLRQQSKMGAAPSLSQYQQKSLKIMRLKQSIQKIEEQLEQYYQESQYKNLRLHEQFINQSKQLQDLKQVKRQLDSQIQVLELRNMVQRNQVAIEIGKVQGLQKQGKQLQQNLKALQKHKQQITQRIQIMKQQQQQYRTKQQKRSEQQQQKHAKVKAQKNKHKHGHGRGCGQQNKQKQKQKQKWTIKQLTEIERQINNLKIEEDKLDLQISQYCKIRIDYEDAVHAVEDGKKNRKKRVAKMDKRLRGLDADIQGLEQELLANQQATKLAAKQIQQLQQYLCTLEQQTTEMQQKLTQPQPRPAQSQNLKQQTQRQRQGQSSGSAGPCSSTLATSAWAKVVKQEENGSKQRQKFKIKSALWKPQIIILLFFIVGVGVILLI